MSASSFKIGKSRGGRTKWISSLDVGVCRTRGGILEGIQSSKEQGQREKDPVGSFGNKVVICRLIVRGNPK